MPSTRVTHDSGIFTIAELFTSGECESLIERAEGIGFETASVLTRDGSRKLLTHIRDNDRVAFDDASLAETMWTRARDLLPVLGGEHATGVDPHLRVYRYLPGQVFRRHRDGVVTNATGAASKLSYLLYLNDCDGGATRFREVIASGEGDDSKQVVEHRIQPTRGSALLFRHERWHEGLPVTSGRKYVLRTDVFYGADRR